ncbi:hypothetical protein [Rickettsia endosymbiont of Halotydeus destructor]|uniref:hypothetical protein n=1 Tax=Rickettsia endosymbiont of Halotydeus destructor TaxID=2996754 RepID=UPI003BAE5566
MQKDQIKGNLSKNQSTQQAVKVPAVNNPLELHDLLKETTQEIQQKNLQIQKAVDKSVSAKKSFTDLKEANLGNSSASNSIDK